MRVRIKTAMVMTVVVFGLIVFDCVYTFFRFIICKLRDKQWTE